MPKLTNRQKAHRKYLRSDEWAKVRSDLLEEVGFKCERCNSKKGLQVHHLSYERFGGDELREDLIVLCKYHHMLEHDLVSSNGKKKKSRKAKKSARLPKKVKHTLCAIMRMSEKKYSKYVKEHGVPDDLFSS